MTTQPPTYHFLTLFPEFFGDPLRTSITGKAIAQDLIRVALHNIRDFTTDKHRSADDTPYGGGAGMVMRPGPLVRAIEAVHELHSADEKPPCVIALTPSGEPFSQEMAQELATQPAIAFLCGRYEGFDERALSWVDRQVSLGDFVLTGGEPAAFAMFDAIIRHVPGVLGNAVSTDEESFSEGLLEYPQFTRPAVFRDMPIPDVLLSGNHAKIAQWRRGQSLLRTLQRRPELFQRLQLSKSDRALLEQAQRSSNAGGSD